MNITFPIPHKRIHCAVRIEAVDPPILYLDLGKPGDNTLFDEGSGAGGPTGPRIACIRTDDGDGWRIVLHSDGGDPFRTITISDDGTITNDEDIL